MMTLDAGPDNLGLCRRIKHDIEKSPWIALLTVWCLMHQFHLGVKGVLMIMDLWEWGEGQEPSQQHFNAIS